jgi:hypothetical protein
MPSNHAVPERIGRGGGREEEGLISARSFNAENIIVKSKNC